MKPNEIAGIVMTLVLFGWIPILAMGSAISKCIKVRTCSRCTCQNCNKKGD